MWMVERWASRGCLVEVEGDLPEILETEACGRIQGEIRGCGYQCQPGHDHTSSKKESEPQEREKASAPLINLVFFYRCLPSSLDKKC